MKLGPRFPNLPWVVAIGLGAITIAGPLLVVVRPDRTEAVVVVFAAVPSVIAGVVQMVFTIYAGVRLAFRGWITWPRTLDVSRDEVVVNGRRRPASSVRRVLLLFWEESAGHGVTFPNFMVLLIFEDVAVVVRTSPRKEEMFSLAAEVADHLGRQVEVGNDAWFGPWMRLIAFFLMFGSLLASIGLLGPILIHRHLYLAAGVAGVAIPAVLCGVIALVLRSSARRRVAGWLRLAV